MVVILLLRKFPSWSENFNKLFARQGKKLMKMVIRIFVVVMAMVFASSPLVAESQNPEVKKKFLFHVKTILDEDDAQICVVPNVAWAAFSKGHDVTLLFDGSAVTSVKRGGIFDTTKTPMDKAELPERL